jgi:hypothetical protein
VEEAARAERRPEKKHRGRGETATLKRRWLQYI